MKNMNCGCLEQKRSWVQVVCEIVEFFRDFDEAVEKAVRAGSSMAAAKPMVNNVDGSYTFNGRKCLLVDNGGRISVVWL